MDTRPESYTAWHEHALGYLAAEDLEVRWLLSSGRKSKIHAAADKRGTMEAHVQEVVEYMSYIIFEAVKGIMSDSLLTCAHTCGDVRRLELWRKLHTEWRGSAPQVVAAKVRRYQDPACCTTVQHLCDALPACEALGTEVVLGGYPVPDWILAQALGKLMPLVLSQVVVTRPELSEHTAKFKFIKSHMEHVHGATQANWVNGQSGTEDMDIVEIANDETSTRKTGL
jgi:hypothetical protein